MTSTSSANKRIAKNTIFMSVRMVIVLVINLFTTRAVLHALGVEDYGVYNVVCGFVSLFSFLRAAMGNGVQRFFNFELGKNGVNGANKVFCTAIYIQAILAIAIVILLESIGPWYIHDKMVLPEGRLEAAQWIFQFAIISFAIGIMIAPFSAAVTAHERMDFYAIISILDATLKLIIALILPLFGTDKLILYGILIMSISCINFIIYYFYTKRNFEEIKFRKVFDRDLFKKMFAFSGWNVFGAFSGVMESQGINLVLNFYFGPIVNAARGVAVQINGGVQSFVTNITIPVRPQVIQSYAQGDLQRTMNLTYSISKISCAIVLMLAIPVSFEMNYILHLWLGETVPDHTAAFAILVLLTSLVNNLNSATSGVVHATGKMRDYQLWGSLVKVLSIPVSFILFKYYRMPEIEFACVFVFNAFSHTVCLFIVRKLVGMSLWYYFKRIVVPIIATMVITVIVVSPFHIFISEGFIRLIIVALVSVAFVVISFYFLGFNKSERELALQLVSSFLKKISIKKKA